MPSNGRERSGRRLVGLAVVDDDRKPELLGEREVGVEETTLLLGRREPPHGVETGLPDGDRLRMRRSSRSSSMRPRLGLGGLVRMDPERRVDPGVAFGDRRAQPGPSRCPCRS